MNKASKAALNASRASGKSDKDASDVPRLVYWKRAHRDWKFWTAALSAASCLLLAGCLKNACRRAAPDRNGTP